MCDCISKLDEKLKEQVNESAEMAVTLTFDGKCYPYMYCEYKQGKRKKTQAIIPSHCPFCGKKYK